MPLPLPILERITLDVEAWLKNVQSPAYASSFTVERRNRQGNAPKAGQTLAVIHLGNGRKLSTKNQHETKWDQPYAIEIFTDPDSTRVTAVDTDLNIAMADAQHALAFDVVSRTRGGLAEDTAIADPIRFVRGELSGIVVPFTVRYATEFNNPYRSAYSNITY